MILNTLKLENFKSHKNTKIEFNNGISLIIGENGAGKSTILESISFALFKDINGKISDLVRKPIDTDDVIKQMSVTLLFNHNGVQYKVQRGRKGNKAIAELYQINDDNLSLLSSGDKNVTFEIEKILSIDPKSFLNAVYIRQGEITDLIEKTASERKELISKLLNIESLEKAWNEMKTITTKYENKKRDYEIRLENKENILEEIKILEENIENNNKSKVTIIEESNKIDHEIENLTEEIKNLNDKKDKKIKLEYEINEHYKAIKKYQEDINNCNKQLEEIDELEKNTARIESEIKKLPELKELEKLKKELDTHTKELKQINEELSKLKENKNKIIDNEDKYIQYNNIKEKNESLINDKEELLKKVNQDLELTTKYENILKNKTKINKELRKKSEFARTIFNNEFNSIETLTQIAKDEETKSKQFVEDLDLKINENNKKISESKAIINENKKSLKDLNNTKDTCPICQSNISHEKHEELTQLYHHNIEENTTRISELNEINENQKKQLQKYKKILEEISELNIPLVTDKFNEFQQLRREEKILKKEIPKIKENNEKLESLNKEIQINEKQIKELEKNYQSYIYAKNRLKEFEDEDTLNDKSRKLNDVIITTRNECLKIINKYAVKDNVEQQIKFLEKQKSEYDKQIGKIENKSNVINNKNINENNLKNEENILDTINKTIEELKYDSKKHEQINRTYEEKTIELNNQKVKIAQIETTIKKDNETLAKHNEDINELKRIEQEKSNVEDYLKILNYIRDEYGKDGVQKQLRESVKEPIQQNTMDIFNEFGFNYSSIELDEDYNITIENKNEKLELNMLSGGEKIVVALALRLGIAKVITKNNTELLILDEPTIHLDYERRNKLIDIIKDINIVPQMLVVTHDDEMESLSHNILKIQKENGVSKIIKDNVI